MALIKFGGGITAMSGSIAGNTFARNRFGYYSRARTKPVNPKSPHQSQMRGILSYLAEAWHEILDDTMRGQWETYAAAISKKNRLGEGIKLTGFQHFIAGNSLRLQNGLALAEHGPDELSLPPTDKSWAVIGSSNSQLLKVTYDPTADWAKEVGGALIGFEGRPQLNTRNFFNGPWQRTGGIYGIVDPPITTYDFTPVFPLITGQRIWVAGRIIRLDGRISTRFVADCVVEAAFP